MTADARRAGGQRAGGRRMQRDAVEYLVLRWRRIQPWPRGRPGHPGKQHRPKTSFLGLRSILAPQSSKSAQNLSPDPSWGQSWQVFLYPRSISDGSRARNERVGEENNEKPLCTSSSASSSSSSSSGRGNARARSGASNCVGWAPGGVCAQIVRISWFGFAVVVVVVTAEHPDRRSKTEAPGRPRTLRSLLESLEKPRGRLLRGIL